jgi:hypothetical protein
MVFGEHDVPEPGDLVSMPRCWRTQRATASVVASWTW